MEKCIFLNMSIVKNLISIRILNTRKSAFRHNLVLLILNFLLVFVIGLIPDKNLLPSIYRVTVSGLFFVAVLSISDRHIRYLFVAIFLTLMLWISAYLKMKYLGHLTFLGMVVFFIYVIAVSVTRISQSKEVKGLEFLRAINIYFMIGIVGGLFFRMLYISNPASIDINELDVLHTTDFLYLSFETITTLGYGDITPISQLAKNGAVFLSFIGQLYLTMIIALLMGKYFRDSERGQEKGERAKTPPEVN